MKNPKSLFPSLSLIVLQSSMVEIDWFQIVLSIKKHLIYYIWMLIWVQYVNSILKKRSGNQVACCLSAKNIFVMLLLAWKWILQLDEVQMC